MTSVTWRLPFAKYFFPVVALGWLAAARALGETPPGPGTPPSIDHIHFTAADPVAAKRLWRDVLGATPATAGALDGVRVQNAFVWIDKGNVAGGTEGSVIRHLGVRVRNLDEVLARAARNFHARRSSRDTAELRAPDGVALEVVGDPRMDTAILVDHVHCLVPDGVTANLWYGERLRLANASFRMEFITAGRTADRMKGRALDHIGFTVPSLDAYRGVLTFEPSTTALAGDATKSIYATDPWGARFELTEKR